MRGLLLIVAVALGGFAVYWKLSVEEANLAELDGMRILLTGGGTGIGKETMKLATAHGARVVITGRTQKNLEAACAGNERCFPLVADAAAEDCSVAVNEAAALMGGLDVVISNHATGRVAKLDEMESVAELRAAYLNTFEANVWGSICLVKAALPHIRKSKADVRGFAQISSLSVYYGISRMSLYSGSKAAMHPVYNAFRVEMRRENIGFTVFNVGHVLTDLANQQMPAEAKDVGMPPAVCGKQILEGVLLRKREVFMAATYRPYLPGFLAFTMATLMPERMEDGMQDMYGQDFVKPIDKKNPLKRN